MVNEESPTPELLNAVRQAFGEPLPPREIWQKAFDHDNRHLLRLVGLRSGERPDSSDLLNYCLDFQYEDVQADLFRFVFPFCLEAWWMDLRGRAQDYKAFVDHFYPALVRGRAFDRVFSRSESVAVGTFLRGCIIEEIDEQRGMEHRGSRAAPYRWMRAMTTYGVLLPDFSALWWPWWSAETVGRAIAAVQYASCLIYESKANPVFPAWTPHEGGGPPHLWEFAGHLYEDRWLEANAAFLEAELNVDSVRIVLDRAVRRLALEPELAVATRVRADFDSRIDIVQRRCRELPDILREVQTPSSYPKWSI